MGDSAEFLFRAIESPNVKILQSLLRKGEDANAQNEFGWSLLSMAAHLGREDLINILIEHKADINPDGRLPVNEAIIKRRIAIVKVLVNNGADVNLRDKYCMNPLGLAAKQCYVEAVHYLLECGADVNMAGKKGNTPLHFAVEGGSLEIIKTLIKNGADLFTPNQKGKTVLVCAAKRNYNYILWLLMQHSLLRCPNMPRPDFSSFHSEFSTPRWDVYESEVNLMINSKFEGSKISLKEFLLERNIHKLVGYLSNINIHTFEELEIFCRSEFPGYADLIIEKFREGKNRECLLHKCYIIADHSKLKKLSVEIMHRITRLLGNEDLNIIVEAALLVLGVKSGSSPKRSSSRSNTSDLAELV